MLPFITCDHCILPRISLIVSLFSWTRTRRDFSFIVFTCCLLCCFLDIQSPSILCILFSGAIPSTCNMNSLFELNGCSQIGTVGVLNSRRLSQNTRRSLKPFLVFLPELSSELRLQMKASSASIEANIGWSVLLIALQTVVVCVLPFSLTLLLGLTLCCYNKWFVWASRATVCKIFWQDLLLRVK